MTLYIHAGLLVLAALLFLAGVSVARRKTGKGWLRFHKFVTILAALLMVSAVAVMFMAKQGKGYPHFSSVHSLVGLGGVVIALLLPVAGFLLLKGVRSLRPVHRRAGHLLLFVILIALVLGALRLF